MRLLLAVCCALLAALPAWAAQPSWIGQWDTRWHEGGARMDLRQQGGQSFMGRFETGKWWTGARVQAAEGGVTLDQAGARQAL